MRQIELLDSSTIDKIAAGEVVERPASIVKELVENAIDAGASTITVEIENGGTSLIRVSDDGQGIPKDQVQKAFWRHATSKIRTVDDLTMIRSLGFRGEALSSIAAVSQVELLTKTEEETYGTRYCIEGGAERKMEPVGIRQGTSIYVRNLFYNVPPRKKFLKTPATEAGHVQTAVTHLSMSHPEVSLRLLINGQEKLHTPGNGELRDVIYSVYGREVTSHLIPVDIYTERLKIRGYLGEPILCRSNRKLENYYLNGRYFTSSVIAKAIEDAYHPYMMQHRYPFVALQIEMDPSEADVNVHPAKLEVRFHRQQDVYATLSSNLNRVLHDHEMLPTLFTDTEKEKESKRRGAYDVQEISGLSYDRRITGDPPTASQIPSQTDSRTAAGDTNGTQILSTPAESVVREPHPAYSTREEYFMSEMRRRVLAHHARRQTEVEDTALDGMSVPTKEDTPDGASLTKRAPMTEGSPLSTDAEESPVVSTDENREVEAGSSAKSIDIEATDTEQLNFFNEKILTKERRKDFRIAGQIFDTYWIVESDGELLIIDQHAAHEKVLYERIYAKLQKETLPAQMVSPPIILHLTLEEQAAIEEHREVFLRSGFEIEAFGGDDYAVRSVPMDLSGLKNRDRLMEMIDEFTEDMARHGFTTCVEQRLATISCKAAVKGGQRISVMEMEALLDELLNMENPYHCPHGRPTMITMTQEELEKRFKRIV